MKRAMFARWGFDGDSLGLEENAFVRFWVEVGGIDWKGLSERVETLGWVKKWNGAKAAWKESMKTYGRIRYLEL